MYVYMYSNYSLNAPEMHFKLFCIAFSPLVPAICHSSGNSYTVLCYIDISAT